MKPKEWKPLKGRVRENRRRGNDNKIWHVWKIPYKIHNFYANHENKTLTDQGLRHLFITLKLLLPSTVAYAFNPSTQEMENQEFKDSHSYIGNSKLTWDILPQNKNSEKTKPVLCDALCYLEIQPSRTSSSNSGPQTWIRTVTLK